MKKITVDLKNYIKSVVDLEDRIKWASSPNITIPKMEYPKATIKGAGAFGLIKSILP